MKRARPERAAVAIAHRILVAAYHMLARTTDYKDLGAGYLDRTTIALMEKQLVTPLEGLGYHVVLEPAAAG